MSLALKLTLAPVLLAQALLTRRRMPRLPEADGARTGTVGDGPALSLLIVGDSSAAGVGVTAQDDAIAGQLSRALARRSGRRVCWQLCARSGLTSAQVLALLREARPAPAEVAVLMTGVNDVVDQVGSRRALAARTELLGWLRRELGVRHLVLTPLPPMHRFIGLPQPLRWMAGRDAAAHDRAVASWAAGQPDVTHLGIELPLDPGMLARDGFHPTAPVYRAWGEALAEHIATRLVPAHRRRPNTLHRETAPP